MGERITLTRLSMATVMVMVMMMNSAELNTSQFQLQLKFVSLDHHALTAPLSLRTRRTFVEDLQRIFGSTYCMGAAQRVNGGRCRIENNIRSR